ncbi:hypothetical protein EL22_08180 [Halostagnicola sp. A56]|uniref:DUF6498-containing protein n=1 Tax=Halostagnicola sp. A56 TaxID=1495067 RepID=UPI00049F06E1|nr:DUF6498-containing protein [Halostagnicola sp. A56]KDE57976.1 hypothetical protein EL22_08180 [Halostagnicola sp. A56]
MQLSRGTMFGRQALLWWAVLSNALSFLGVLLWNWDVTTLVSVYWLEIGIGLFWATLKAGFAERPADYSPEMFLFGAFRYRRGGVSIPRTDLVWYLHNLPIVAFAGVGFGGAWIAIGLLAIGQMPGFQEVVQPGSGTFYSVLAVGISLFVGNSWKAVSTYIGGRRYRELNAQQVLQEALWPLWIFGVIIMLVAPTVTGEVTTLLFLIPLLVMKFAFDLVWTFYETMLSFDEKIGGWLGVAETGTGLEWDPRPLERSRPTDSIRPHRFGVLLGGVTNGVRSLAGTLVGLFGGWVCFVLLLGADLVVLEWLAVALALLGGLGVFDHVLRHWWTRYQFDETDDLVCYGARSAGPHWRLDLDRIESLERNGSRVDRLLGTTTLRIDLENDEQTIRLPYLKRESARTIEETIDASAADAKRAATGRF